MKQVAVATAVGCATTAGGSPRRASGRSCAGSRRWLRPAANAASVAGRPGQQRTTARRPGGGRRRGRARTRAVVVAAGAPGSSGPAADERLRGPSAGRQRLADALAGERIGGRGGVAHEQRPPGASAAAARHGRGSARPGAVPRAGRRSPSRARMWGRASSAGQVSFMARTARPAPGGPRSRCWPRRRRRGTTRSSRAGCRARRARAAHGGPTGPTSGDVLAEGVPIAPVARLGDAQVLAQRRPGAVGADGVVRLDAAPGGAGDVEHHPVRRGWRAPVSAAPSTRWRRPSRARRDQRGVEVAPAGHRGERAARCGAAGSARVRPAGERRTTSSTVRHDGTAPGSRPSSSRARSAGGRQAVAAALVAGGSGPCRPRRRRARPGPA